MTALVTKHLPLVAGAPDGIKKLRALILQLAVSGKLIGATSRLWPEMTLGELGSWGSGGTPAKTHPEYYGGDIPWLVIGDLNDGLVESSESSITSEGLNNSSAKVVPAGTILIAMYGSIGKLGIAAMPCATNQAIAHCSPNEALVKRMYLFLLLRSMRDALLGQGQGLAQQNISQKILKSVRVKVPSIEEQALIEAKVEELMALCDRLEADQADAEAAHAQLVQALLDSLTHATDAAEFRASWQRLSEHFHTLFTTEASIDALKQTVLQLAVMGKLVAQVESDGAAADLLATIATLRNSKAPPPPIEGDTLPTLPPRWCWVHIADLAHVGTGATPSRTNPGYFNPPEISWVTSGETSQAFVSATEQKVSPLALSETNLTVYPAGTLVVAMYGQGKTRGQVTELLIDACTNQACAAIRLVCDEIAHRRYVKYFFEKSYDELRSLAAGGAQPNLNLGKIKETAIPLPPLKEQHRIVAKVDELMALCDQLKAQLAEGRQQHAQLATVLVEQAVA